MVKLEHVFQMRIAGAEMPGKGLFEILPRHAMGREVPFVGYKLGHGLFKFHEKCRDIRLLGRAREFLEFMHVGRSRRPRGLPAPQGLVLRKKPVLPVL